MTDVLLSVRTRIEKHTVYMVLGFCLGDVQI